MNTNAEISEPPLTFDELAQIDIARLKGVGEAKQRALHEYGISDVLELLMTYPRRWVDRTNQQRVADAALGEEVLLVVEVRGVEERQMRNRRKMVNVRVGDGTGTLRITFFNQPWRARQLTIGLVVAIHGKVEDYRGSLQMTNRLSTSSVTERAASCRSTPRARRCASRRGSLQHSSTKR